MEHAKSIAYALQIVLDLRLQLGFDFQSMVIEIISQGTLMTGSDFMTFFAVIIISKSQLLSNSMVIKQTSQLCEPTFPNDFFFLPETNKNCHKTQ